MNSTMKMLSSLLNVAEKEGVVVFAVIHHPETNDLKVGLQGTRPQLLKLADLMQGVGEVEGNC